MASLALNGSGNLTGETTDSIDGLDLKDNARMLGCIGVDTECSVSLLSALRCLEVQPRRHLGYVGPSINFLYDPL